ncbi:hypothetical protein Rhal01_02662 [Rubritalea halochordaticola]|uniref:Uncharacterized protein n=1 Tax=Rubritalea halochordaticola TaxID=714537 RepID=A0ABP9V1D0_9BACT
MNIQSLFSGEERSSSDDTKKTPQGQGKVYFVYRSEYEYPLGHRVVSFDSPNLLEWFKDHWVRERRWNDDLAEKRTEKILQGHVYGFEDVWEAMWDQRKDPPQNLEQLREFIESIDYFEGELCYQDGAIECLTNNDDIDISWYLFDEQYAQENRDRVAYLLHDDWRLPESVTSGVGPFPGGPAKELSEGSLEAQQGSVYCLFLSALDGQTLSDITGAYRFKGVSLPDFAEFLRGQSVRIEETAWGTQRPEWPEELLLLRALVQQSQEQGLEDFMAKVDSKLINQEMTQARPLNDLRHSVSRPELMTGDAEACARDLESLRAYVKEQEKNSSQAHDYQTLSRLQLSPHLCQIRFDTEEVRKDTKRVTSRSTKAYLFFDDQWATSHPDLAQSLLHYARGWQVLHQD